MSYNGFYTRQEQEDALATQITNPNRVGSGFIDLGPQQRFAQGPAANWQTSTLLGGGGGGSAPQQVAEIWNAPQPAAKVETPRWSPPAPAATRTHVPEPHSPSSQQASNRLVRLGRLGQIRLLSDRLFNPFAIDIAPRALMQLRRPRRRRPRRCSRLSSPGRAWAGGPCRKPKRRSRSGSISQMVARSLPARRLRRRDPR